MRIALILVSSLVLVSGFPIPNPAWSPPPPSSPRTSPTLSKELILPPLPPPRLPSPLQPITTKMRKLSPRSPFFGYHFRYYTPGPIRTPVLRYSPYRGYYRKRRRRSEGSRFIDRDTMGVREGGEVLEDLDLGGEVILSSPPSSSSTSYSITPTSTSFETTIQTGVTTDGGTISTIPTPTLEKRKVVTITEYPIETRVQTIKIPKSMRSTITKTETRIITATATLYLPSPSKSNPPAETEEHTQFLSTAYRNSSTPSIKSSETLEVMGTTTFALTITSTTTSTKKGETSSSRKHPPKTTAPPIPSPLPSSLEFLRPPTRHYEPPGLTPCPCPSMASQIQLTNRPLLLPEQPPPPEQESDKNLEKREGLSSVFKKLLSFIHRPHHSSHLKPSSNNPVYKLPKRDEKGNKDLGSKIELEKKPTCPCLNPANEIPDPRDDKRKLPAYPFYKKKRVVKRKMNEDFQPERGKRVKIWKG
ncbi:hypothetical protein TWF506_006128 [Arthrobotrys conoides]|uniref:Uncharacterized protein n=1 Tax=Arthrobotrys conoides TaxID=74498 RepID=A0AAN8NBM3_9PEZI